MGKYFVRELKKPCAGVSFWKISMIDLWGKKCLPLVCALTEYCASNQVKGAPRARAAALPPLLALLRRSASVYALCFPYLFDALAARAGFRISRGCAVARHFVGGKVCRVRAVAFFASFRRRRGFRSAARLRQTLKTGILYN